MALESWERGVHLMQSWSCTWDIYCTFSEVPERRAFNSFNCPPTHPLLATGSN